MDCLVVIRLKKPQTKRHIIKIIRDYGDAILPSVYRATLPVKYKTEMVARLERYREKLSKDEFVRIIPVCARCCKSEINIGSPPKDNNPLYYLA